jgi:hypothetical protein
MKLRFLPAEGSMPLVPFTNKMPGSMPRYLGRTFNAATGVYDISEPYECEAGSPEAERCKVFVRRKDALPADEQTARAIGAAWKKETKSARAAGGESA